MIIVLNEIKRAQFEKAITRIQSESDRRQKPNQGTYKGKSAIDGTAIIAPDGGAATSGYRKISNRSLTDGDRVNIRASQGLPRVDAKNVAPLPDDAVESVRVGGITVSVSWALFSYSSDNLDPESLGEILFDSRDFVEYSITFWEGFFKLNGSLVSFSYSSIVLNSGESTVGNYDIFQIVEKNESLFDPAVKHQTIEIIAKTLDQYPSGEPYDSLTSDYVGYFFSRFYIFYGKDSTTYPSQADFEAGTNGRTKLLDSPDIVVEVWLSVNNGEFFRLFNQTFFANNNTGAGYSIDVTINDIPDYNYLTTDIRRFKIYSRWKGVDSDRWFAIQ